MRGEDTGRGRRKAPVWYPASRNPQTDDQELLCGWQGTDQADVDKLPECTDVLDSPLMVEEVRRQLRRLPAYSAPRPDGVTYVQWKRLDPEGKLLSIIMNVCRKSRQYLQAGR